MRHYRYIALAVICTTQQAIREWQNLFVLENAPLALFWQTVAD